MKPTKAMLEAQFAAEGKGATSTTPTQAQVEAARKLLRNSSCFSDEVCSLLPCKCIEEALTAAAEVRPADISCPFCGGENGQHDHNCGLKKTAAAADPALRDFIKDTPVSEPNDGWAAEAGGEVIRTARERYLIYATIERCAQVLEPLMEEITCDSDFYKMGINDTVRKGQAAIRVLKEI